MRPVPLLLVSLLVSTGLGLAPTALAQGGADRDWRFVQQLLSDGMNQVAARQLEEFARTYGEDERSPQALLQAATLYRELEQPVAALGAYDRLLEQFPNGPEAPRALLLKAEALAEGERHEHAIESYQRLLSSYPASDSSDRARLGLGEALLALDRRGEAARLFRLLIGGKAPPPIAARAQFDLAVIHEAAGEDSLAVHEFESIHQRYPGEVVGAFGLVRAAELLTRQGARDAARQRYELALDRFQEPFLQARALLGLAEAEEGDGLHRDAAKHFERVAERGGSPEQVQRALLGMGRNLLAAGDTNGASRAGRAYLEKYGDEDAGAPRAKLLVAQAKARRGEGDEDLVALGEAAPRDVAQQAYAYLAQAREERKDLPGAVAAWRSAVRAAPEADDRVRHLLEQARITGDRMGRHGLAADLCMEAATVPATEELLAEARLHGMRHLVAANETVAAAAAAEEILKQHPLSPQAAEARRELSLIRRRAQRDPEAAAHELAALAVRTDLDAGPRALQAGRILRDSLGDMEAATQRLEEAKSAATTPALAAEASLALGRTAQVAALEATLTGRSQEADQWTRRARGAFADAMSSGDTPSSFPARLAILRLELAAAVRTDEPALFDAKGDPVLGGVGATEAVDLSDEAVMQVSRRMRGALEDATGPERSWLMWRVAEMDETLEPGQRIAVLQQALEGAPDQDSRRRIYYTLGHLQAEAGESAAAATALREVLKDDAQDDLAIAARYTMAEAHRGAKRYDEAGKLYLEYARVYPGSQRGQRALLLAGDCALFLDLPEEASGHYRYLLENHPEGIYADDASYRLGTALQRLGQRDAARHYFHQLSRDDDTRYAGRALLKLARLDRAAGADSTASAALQRLVQIDPGLASDSDVLREIAALELDRGNADESLRWLDRALDQGEGQPSAGDLSLRARALAAAGRLGDAQEELDRLSRGYPEAADDAALARLDLADGLAEDGKNEEAESAYEAAANGAHDSALKARAVYGRALLLARVGRVEDSLPLFEQATREAAESEWGAQGWFKVGQIRSRLGDDEGAVRAYQALIAHHPTHELAPSAYRGAAGSWRQMGRFDKALAEYHKLLEEFPDLPEGETVLSSIAYCHHEMGQFKVAIDAYQKVLPLLDEEGQAYAQFWIADSNDQLGKLEDAAAGFLKIPYLYTSFGQLAVTAQLRAADVYERMQRTEAATRLYQKVLEQHGASSQWGAEARKRLDRLVVSGDGGS